jgi:hypothetical protein
MFIRKRMWIATIQNHYSTIPILLNPLVFHYTLSLMQKFTLNLSNVQLFVGGPEIF